MKRTDLNSTEYAPYQKSYIELVDQELNIRDAFFTEGILRTFYNNLPFEKLSYRYAEGKWSMKEVYQHIIDTERIFAYRAFRVGRLDPTPLPGFDQDDFIKTCGADDKDLIQLQHEYDTTRAFTASIYSTLSDKELCFIGEASGFSTSARALGFMILGHELWHLKIMKERYL